MCVCVFRKHRKHSRKPTSEVVPLVSYQSADDDDGARASVPVFGPFLPSHDSTSKHTIPAASSTVPKSEQRKTLSSSAASKPTETGEKPDKNATKTGEKYGDEIQKLKALHEKFQKRTKQMKHSTSKDKETVVHGDSANFPPSLESSSKPAATAEVLPDVGCLASDVEVVREETLETADDQPFVRYEFVNRRFEGDVVGPSAEDVDMDDIDKQLEMALARHYVSAEASVSV